MNILHRMDHPFRCKLTEDLRKYHPELTIGAEGVINPKDCESRFGPNFVCVAFDKAGWQDIKWQGIEVLDEDWKAWEEILTGKRKERMKVAREAVRICGPRGGFKEFFFEYVDPQGGIRREVTAMEHEADRWTKELQELGKGVRIEKMGVVRRI